MRNTPTYSSWCSLKTRCLNPNGLGYRAYGACGISVCERWMDFSLFLEDMGERPSIKYTIDRIDNEKGYEPGNCRWATWLQQAANRRKVRRPIRPRKYFTMKRFASLVGISRQALYLRLEIYGSLEAAMRPEKHSHSGIRRS